MQIKFQHWEVSSREAVNTSPKTIASMSHMDGMNAVLLEQTPSMPIEHLLTILCTYFAFCEN
jgi:hypothetical protein